MRVLLNLSLLLMACEVKISYQPCGQDSDCPGSAVCKEGYCFELAPDASVPNQPDMSGECATDRDCAHLTGACFVYRCQGGLCLAWPRDDDGDGTSLCGKGGYPGSLDCNDADPLIYPGAAEVCSDGLDNNCDGKVDCGDVACAPCLPPDQPDMSGPTDGGTSPDLVPSDPCEPSYWLTPDSPGGPTSPSFSTILKFSVSAPLGCDLELTQIGLTARFTDLQQSGWTAQRLTVSEWFSPTQSLSSYFHDAGPGYQTIAVNETIFLPAGSTKAFILRADSNGPPRPASGDVIRGEVPFAYWKRHTEVNYRPGGKFLPLVGRILLF